MSKPSRPLRRTLLPRLSAATDQRMARAAEMLRAVSAAKQDDLMRQLKQQDASGSIVAALALAAWGTIVGQALDEER